MATLNYTLGRRWKPRMGLLSRVLENPEAHIEVNQLYSAFDFEMKEGGAYTNYSKRVFVDHVLKVFPKAIRKRCKDSTTITIYMGISLKPVSVETSIPVPSESKTPEHIKDLLPPHVESVQTLKDSVTCAVDTNCFSNGNKVLKIVTFLSNGKWTLEVSGHLVNLDSVFISNTYTVNRESIANVIHSVKLLHLCDGTNVTKTVIMTRYHTLETWKSCEMESRQLRSLVCNRVVPMNALSTTCRKCIRMTFSNSNQKDTAPVEKENATSTKPDENRSKTPKVVTKEDIKKLIPEANDEMVELLLSQAQNVKRDPRGRRWTQNIISLCLQWYCRSPQSYESVRASNYLVLPSKSILLQYKNKVKQDVGFDNNIFRWMLEEAKRNNIPAEGYVGGLIIDEMAIQADIQISKAGDVIELSGLMDVGEEGNISHILRKGKNERILGTHALQLVFLGITGFRFPVAHFVSDGIQAPELYPLFWEAVDKLHMYGFKTLYTCMDGAQSNRSFMKINIGSNSTTYKSQCPCNFGDMVFMMDSSHVIKKIRNNIIKSGITKGSTRTLTLSNGDTIQWQMFIDGYHWDRNNALQLHRKLTNEHLYPSNQSKMRNHLAEDILDSEMLHVMLQYQHYLGAKGSILNGVIVLLKNTSKLIQIFRDMRPVKLTSDPRLSELLSVAEWFKNWESSALNNEALPSKNRGKLILSLQCHEDIQSCIIAFVELCKIVLNHKTLVYITPGLVNSDVIENTFNQQRSTYNGANSNPNALQYRRALNNIVLGQNIVSQKANAGKSRAAALPYNCSLKPTARKRRSPDSSAHNKIKVIRM